MKSWSNKEYFNHFIFEKTGLDWLQ